MKKGYDRSSRSLSTRWVIENKRYFSDSIFPTFSEENYGKWRETGVLRDDSQSDEIKPDVL